MANPKLVTATHFNASGGIYTDTETTVTFTPGSGAVNVTIQCVGRLQWWCQPSAAQVRKWVDSLILELGFKRDGARIDVSSGARDSWRFLYGVAAK